MIINSELFLRTFQIIESEPLPILFILHPYYAKRSHRRKTCPRRGKRQKIPPGKTSGGISCSYQPVQPAGKHRCRRRASSRPLPLRHGRTIAESSMHWQDSLRRSPSPFPTCLQLISLSLGLDDNGLRAAASGPVETAFVRAVILMQVVSSGQLAIFTSGVPPT